jgi:hypothetical protein
MALPLPMVMLAAGCLMRIETGRAPKPVLRSLVASLRKSFQNDDRLLA